MHLKIKGSAIVSALLVIAMVSAILFMVILHNRASLERTADMLSYENAYAHVLGVEDWAIGRLVRYKQLTPEEQVTQAWPIRFSPIEFGGGVVSGEIFDAQSRFNLNNLTQEQAVAPAVNMMALLLDRSNLANDPEALVNQIRDFVGPDLGVPLPRNAYERANPPYKVPHRLMVQTSELRLVADVNQPVFNVLYPYVTALPEETPLNVNTASAEVMLSLHEALPFELLQDLVQERDDLGGFANIDEFFAQFEDLDGVTIPDNAVTLDSTFFLIHGQVLHQQNWVQLYSLVKVLKQGNQATVTVVWRSLALP